ncbi:unnamed protein product [Schistocephalus solidus]|uniref:F-box domain-containing protein n=1 Tax=Schistocephalus solidus TaxID=70667 RepID=A0A183SIK4_SCHSO|nr:unnamed protein product [Schistocephalus solidus]
MRTVEKLPASVFLTVFSFLNVTSHSSVLFISTFCSLRAVPLASYFWTEISPFKIICSFTFVHTLLSFCRFRGGLSNYLYVGYLKDEVAIDKHVPKKVFIRVYGELLRSNMNSVVLDAVIFALLSEKGLGPKIHGVFPGGRIEEFVEVSYFFFTHTFHNVVC